MTASRGWRTRQVEKKKDGEAHIEEEEEEEEEFCGGSLVRVLITGCTLTRLSLHRGGNADDYSVSRR